MQTWTVDEMLSHSPCPDYDRDHLLQLWNGKDRLTVLEILDLPIPASDRVWAVLQDGPHVDGAIEKILTRCITNHVLHCGMPFVEKWAADWLSGADRTHESARAAAKWSDAAFAATVAMVALPDAALAATLVAASYPAAEAERELQISDIRTSAQN